MKNQTCTICGSTHFAYNEVLWQELISDWELLENEVNYINRQQGFFCTNCGNNLRCLAHAKAILSSQQFSGTLAEFVVSESAAQLHVLEINEAGNLTSTLAKLPHHRLIKYPEYDMMKLPIASGSFDLVLHSDTLEHIPDPLRALTECRRILKPGGKCIYTVPMIVDRLSKSRQGLKPSYHGAASQELKDHIVHTEFGADAWKWLALAGFSKISFHVLEFPSAIALLGE